MKDEDRAAELARVNEALRAEIAERKRAEEELRAEKEFSENMLNALVDTVFVFDLNTGNPLRWNKAFNEISGCTDEEIASKKAPDDWYSEEDLKRAEAATEKVFLEGLATVEMSLITRDRSLIPTEYTGSLIKDGEGRPQYLIAVGRDITARKRAEEALRESEEKYRDLVENISDVIYAVDEDGLLTYVSPAIESFIGYSPSEVIGHHFREFIYQQDLPRLMESFQSIFSGHTTANEYRALTKSGEIRWMRTSSRPVLMGNHVIGVHGVLADITEGKRAEEALQESEERYRSLFEGAEDHIFVVDQDFRYVMVNESALRAGGFTLEDAVGKDARELFPEDAEFYLSQYHRAFETGEPIRFERELKLPDGIRWFSVTLSPIKDARQRVIALTGISRDITERKRAEEEITRLAKFPSENPNPVLRVGKDGTILYANRASLPLLDVWGCQIGQVLPDHWRRFVLDVLSCGASKDAEIEYEDRILSLTFAPVVDADQVNVYGLDITERKQAEEEIRQHMAQLEALREVGLEITAELDLDSVIRYIVLRAIKLVGGTGGGLHLHRRDRDVLEWSVSIDPDAAPIGTVLHRGEGLSGKVWESGEPLIVDDYQTWEGRAVAWEDYRITAAVGVPVRWGEEFLGVLNVRAARPRTFSPADAELLDLFATQAAIAIRNARLYEEYRRRALEQETVSHIAYALNTPDVRDGFPILVESLQNLIGCEMVNLVMMDEAGEQFIMSVLGSPIPTRREVEVMPLSATSAAEDLEAGRPHLTADLNTETHFPFERALYQAGLCSQVTLPLLVADEVFGALNLGSSDTGLFQEDQLPILRQIADAVALALQNSLLFQAEQERRHIAETLRQASTVISSTLELDEVLGLILQQLRQVIPYDSASVQRLENARLEIVACQGFEEPDKVVGLVFPLNRKFPNYRVLTTKAPLTIEDVVQDYPHFKDEADIYNSGRIRSWLGVPLMVKDEVIGMIALDRVEVRPYTAEEAQLAMTFANQAGIAIENAQLYQKTQRLAITDGLTGLHNRRHFYELLEREVESVNRYGDHLSLIMLDLDAFKAYNDTHGHLAGDALLRELAQLLTREIRKVDIAARYGGDEFVIFLPRTDKKQAVILAERIRTSVEGHRFPGEEGLGQTVAISLGVAVCPDDAVETEALVKAADVALLEAKKRGNRVYTCG